ncbi:3-isopropylmalate dehydratase small subunit [Ferruginivarius sediminum]|uniref:3-isopropylmalate dehydratase small subunit n=1 Tax=Ferruginivarius sediminum TaxID=2661937 RepID=A0A369TDV7_9PROT|nr:3-isopropylmalate dehydratase small subunit [Ferruginivarius sediminum]RDD63503.1 3-isopropylmalate dehydratase small subunit [Ferruginivarius sediminum]
MDKFTKLTAIAVPLERDNVDTDMIIPKQFLTTIKRTGLSRGLFYELRYDENGKPTEFVLDKPEYKGAQILVAGENFGCGSSREHAPWALLDHGIRCVIAESFADIFYNNCFKNGILPVKLPAEQLAACMAIAKRGGEAAMMTVDLESQTVATPDGDSFPFEVEPFRKHCLLNGLDDIALTLEDADAISAFEGKQRQAMPWLYS